MCYKFFDQILMEFGTDGKSCLYGKLDWFFFLPPLRYDSRFHVLYMSYDTELINVMNEVAVFHVM